jgi:hypothetical protein
MLSNYIESNLSIIVVLIGFVISVFAYLITLLTGRKIGIEWHILGMKLQVTVDRDLNPETVNSSNKEG